MLDEQPSYTAHFTTRPAAIDTHAATQPPSIALRFAPAFLYASGNIERRPHDAFWLAIRTPLPTDTRLPRRPGDMLNTLQAIIRNVGIVPSSEILLRLRTRAPYVAELQVRRVPAELLREDARGPEAAKERERRYHGRTEAISLETIRYCTPEEDTCDITQGHHKPVLDDDTRAFSMGR